jgi:hypothetical protein
MIESSISLRPARTTKHPKKCLLKYLYAVTLLISLTSASISMTSVTCEQGNFELHAAQRNITEEYNPQQAL